MHNNQILIVDDDRIIRDSLCDMLELDGYYCNSAENARLGLSELERGNYSIIITDINLPDNSGLELLRSVRRYYPDIIPIIITGYGSIISAVEAIQEGAFDYLTKPIDDNKLKDCLNRAFTRLNMKRNSKVRLNSIADKDNTKLQDIIGCDMKMLNVFEMAESAAPTKATILITGKSGTGKSMTARAIHQMSQRADKPFIEVSCGSLSETLLESELFGHIKGAFTGATADKDGKFLAANGGTIFLDEINSASPALQVKLLRLIQERQFEPVGSNQTHTVDVRIILATNKDLKAMVDLNQFREDLYYRINVINIQLPALNQRITDIPILAEHFLKKMCEYHNKKFSGFVPDVINALENYDWPGNVRELENAIERAVVLGRNTHIELSDLPDNILNDKTYNGNEVYAQGSSLKKALELPEKEIIISALKQHNWNRNKTAEVLEINRTTLYKKMRYYNLGM